MVGKIKIILAQNKALTRKSFVALLSNYPLFNIVGEASNEKELMSLLKKHSTDVVLLEDKLSGSSLVQLIELIRLRFEGTKVVVIGEQQDMAAICAGIASGASGYIWLNDMPEQLVYAVENVHNNGFFLDKELSEKLLLNLIYKTRENKGKQTLSQRELDVLSELREGKSEKEIAIKMNISKHTVHFHRSNIYVKTQTHNLAQLLKKTAYLF